MQSRPNILIPTLISILEAKECVSLAESCAKLDRPSPNVREISFESSTIHIIAVASDVDVVSVFGRNERVNDVLKARRIGIVRGGGLTCFRILFGYIVSKVHRCRSARVYIRTPMFQIRRVAPFYLRCMRVWDQSKSKQIRC